MCDDPDTVIETDNLQFFANILVVTPFALQEKNKMELLQSQAPVDQELSGSSASARHGTFDIGH